MTANEIPTNFLSTDEDGYLVHEENRITNPEIGAGVFETLTILPNNSFGAIFHDEPVIVEAFDSPLLVRSIERVQNKDFENVKEVITESFNSLGKTSTVKNTFENTADNDGQFLKLNFNYNYSLIIEVNNFYLDSWDRIHGELENGVPFTLTRKAQEQFFEMLDEYSDEDFEWAGSTVKFNSFWSDNTVINGPNWWNKIYEEEENPAWNLAEPTETLKDMLPRLKLPKSKILVLGCGDSHDAAYFAEHGHIVTAVDISPHAIERSKKLFGHLDNIRWVESDLFNLPSSFYGQFDIVYEYTCFCAIDPERRKDLIKIWTRCLHEQGQLMGTFFCMHKRHGPPFGATEWEIRESLKKNFQFIFWGRWRKSLPRRQGRELFVLAKKKV